MLAFSARKVQTKAETIEGNMMASAKQKTFIFRITGVYSLLERGLNYLLTGIMKNLVLHGIERF